MTRVLLDTTFLIDAERDSAVLDEMIADDDDAAIAAVTVAELQVGVAFATGRRRDARQAFLQGVIDSLPVVTYDLAVADAHAGLLAYVRRQGTPRGAHHLIIAATALAAGRALVTADRTAFESLPGLDYRFHR